MIDPYMYMCVCMYLRSAQLNDQRASCAGIEGHVGRGVKSSQGKPPLLRSRTLPAIVVPGVNILQAQIDARYVPGILC